MRIGANCLALRAKAVLLASLLAAFPNIVAAQNCEQMIRQFASTHNLNTAPPPKAAAPETGGMTGDSAANGTMADGESSVANSGLAQSGGVVRPPDVGSGVMIKPPSENVDAMPTTPSIRPETSEATPGAGGIADEAARQAQLESLLDAARAAARQGDEQQCRSSLAEAENLVQRQQ